MTETQQSFLSKALRPNAQQYLSVPQGIRTSTPLPINTGTSGTSSYSGWRETTPQGYSSPSTPSPAAGPGGSVQNWISPHTQAVDIPSYENGGQEDYHSLSDAELMNMQLENAVMLKQLGYRADISDGSITYTKYQTPSYSPYAQYGTSESQYVYEADYLRANIMQMPRERYKYPPSQPAYGQYGYDQQRQYQPYRRRYYNSRYYSNYGQRYNNNGYYNGYDNGYNNYNRGQYKRRSDGYANRYNTRGSSRRTRSWF